MKEQIDIQELLIKAIEDKDLDSIKFLIKNGADVNKLDLYYDRCTRSTLFLNSCHVPINIFEILLESADLSIVDHYGDNILHELLSSQNPLKKLRLLVNNVHFIQMINIKNKNGHTPLELAKLYKKHDIVKFFEEQIAKNENIKSESNKKYNYQGVLTYYYEGSKYSLTGLIWRNCLTLTEFCREIEIHINEGIDPNIEKININISKYI